MGQDKHVTTTYIIIADVCELLKCEATVTEQNQPQVKVYTASIPDRMQVH